MVFNILNAPAGIVPVTRVTQKDVDAMAQYPDTDADHRKVKEVRTLRIPCGGHTILSGARLQHFWDETWRFGQGAPDFKGI